MTQMKGGIRAEQDTAFEEFSALLMQKHGVAVKENWGALFWCGQRDFCILQGTRCFSDRLTIQLRFRNITRDKTSRNASSALSRAYTPTMPHRSP